MDLLARTIYSVPEPPPRKREKPMEVICPGFPRSGTESLQVALLKLGYDYTYHGWDVVFETPHRMPAWARLARKKCMGAGDGESNITREDFDALLGHSVAVTDAAASVFAAEMITAYPEAKVVLNRRKDLEAWHKSVIAAQAVSGESWSLWLISFLSAGCFWPYHVYGRTLWSLLFRAQDGNTARAIRRNGKWIYREHENMIRGLVPKENLLEWSVEDGWEPLCKFLGKPVPDEPFPNTNDAAGFQQRITDYYTAEKRVIIRNVVIASSVLVGAVGLGLWRFSPEWFARNTSWVQDSIRSTRR